MYLAKDNFVPGIRCAQNRIQQDTKLSLALSECERINKRLKLTAEEVEHFFFRLAVLLYSGSSYVRMQSASRRLGRLSAPSWWVAGRGGLRGTSTADHEHSNWRSLL